MNIFSEKLIAWYAENKREIALAGYHRPLYYMDFRDYTAQTRVAQG